MARINYENKFGSQGARLDLQRNDLWKVSISLPTAVGIKWEEEVQFAVEKFPFPAREKESIPVKYLQQTNKQIGGDTDLGTSELTIRYPFQARTAEALEKWFWLVANPRTGGVGLTSQVKSEGWFRYLVPNMARQVADLQKGANPSQDSLTDGLVWKLEGVWPKAFKMTDADMTTGNALSMCLVTFAIDRYYPYDINDMTAKITSAS
jgi:hypothetical protein